MDAPFSFNRLIRIGPPGPDHGGFGGSDGAPAPQAQQGGAVSGEGVAGQAGRTPDPAFAEAAGTDAATAGGAGPPGPQRRHGAARRSGRFALNVRSDNILLRLRRPGASGYSIPLGQPAAAGTRPSPVVQGEVRGPPRRARGADTRHALRPDARMGIRPSRPLAIPCITSYLVV